MKKSTKLILLSVVLLTACSSNYEEEKIQDMRSACYDAGGSSTYSYNVGGPTITASQQTNPYADMENKQIVSSFTFTCTKK
jgi:hypothetical protein